LNELPVLTLNSGNISIIFINSFHKLHSGYCKNYIFLVLLTRN